MKKILLFCISILILPTSICFGFHLMNPEIVIGVGDNSIEKHYLGKEVMIEINGLYKSIDVEEYVVGIMAGVIPVDYEMETLKAQAVLIRTNVLKEMEEEKTKEDSDISYKYLTKEERQKLWGRKQYNKCEERMEQAVIRTAGKVIKYEGNMIMALYHEVSIGKTADAKEILDEDILYLKSVDSSQDVESKNYLNIINYPLSDGESNIVIEESTENGFVKKISVDGNIYTGNEAMELYNLPSMNFYIEKTDDGMRFVCLGKGNCMGLSQYGANIIAKRGSDYEEIIHHYFHNVSIENVLMD